MISNLIGHILDLRLAQLAAKAGCYYTRYADDLTFSTRKKVFPSAIAKRSTKNENRWLLSKPLRVEIKDAVFTINKTKPGCKFAGLDKSSRAS